MIRLHDGRSLTAVPVYLPEDPAIPVKGVPAEASFTREFVADHELLQREQKTAAPALWGVAYAVVLGIALAFLGLLAWGVHRVSTARMPEAARPQARKPPGTRTVSGLTASLTPA